MLLTEVARYVQNYQVALLLGTAESEAREFCLQVQKQFIGSVPSFHSIAECLEQHIDAKNNPHEIARFIQLAHPQVVSALTSYQTGKLKRRRRKSRRGIGYEGAGHGNFADNGP